MSSSEESKHIDERNGMTILSDAECWELLARAPYGRLAVAVNRFPDIFPINFASDGRAIYFVTASGSKLLSLVTDARVTFEIDGFDEAAGEAYSVVVHGTARTLRSGEDRDYVDGLGLHPWSLHEKPWYVRIDVESMSGREFVPEGRTV